MKEIAYMCVCAETMGEKCIVTRLIYSSRAAIIN